MWVHLYRKICITEKYNRISKRLIYIEILFIINVSFLSVSRLIDLSLQAVAVLLLLDFSITCGPVSYRKLSEVLFMVSQMIELVAPEALARYWLVSYEWKFISLALTIYFADFIYDSLNSHLEAMLLGRCYRGSKVLML